MDEATKSAVSICLSIVGNLSINFGTNMIKFAHMSAQDKALSNIEQAQVDSPNIQTICPDNDAIRKRDVSMNASGTGTFMWYSGSIVFVLGNIFNFCALSLGDQSTLAALGSVQFVSNIVCAHFMLGVHITVSVVLGTAVILTGNTLVVVTTAIIVESSKKSTGFYTAEDLLGFYAVPATVIYLCFAGSFSLLLQGAYMMMRKHYALSSSAQRSIPLCFALVSAIVGTQSVVLSKAFSNLLIATLSGNNQLNHFFTYIVIILLAVFMWFWLRRMNAALRMFDAQLIIPVMQVCWILFSIISGGIYYQEFNDFTMIDSIIFVSGIMLILIGVSILARTTVNVDDNNAMTKVDTTDSSTQDGGSGGAKPSFVHARSSRTRNLSVWSSLSVVTSFEDEPNKHHSAHNGGGSGRGGGGAHNEIPHIIAALPQQVTNIGKSATSTNIEKRNKYSKPRQ